jgi:hypothetical protein
MSRSDAGFDARVRRGLRNAAGVPPPQPPLQRTLDRSRELDRRRRALAVAVPAAAAAAVAVVALVLATTGRTTPPPAPAEPGADVRVAPMTPGPLSARRHAAVALTDRGLFVWGGEDEAGRPADDGAMYDPTTATWRTIADSPLPGRTRAAALALADGRVLVAGGVTEVGETGRRPLSDAALYSPATDEWTPLPDAPTCPWLLVPLPRSVVALGSCRPTAADTAAWSVRTQTWETLPDTGDDTSLVSASRRGDDVVAVDGTGRVLVLSGGRWDTPVRVPVEAGVRPTVAVGPAGVFRVDAALSTDGTRQTGVVRRLDGETWTEVARGPELVADDFATPATIPTADGFIWVTLSGICRLAATDVSCVDDDGGLGLTRFATDQVYDPATDRSYLWGGDFVQDDDGRSRPSDTGVTVDW